MAVVYTTDMDVSMDFTIKDVSFDLYDLSGDGSKYFLTVNGKYSDKGTDFSVNYWPHTYSPYKIETIKRETAALQDSSFVYTSDVSDISFTMSVVPGNGTTRDCTKFNVRQADKSVQVHSNIKNGISYELKDFIFYNLFDTTGKWYQKAKETKVFPTTVYDGTITYANIGTWGSYTSLLQTTIEGWPIDMKYSTGSSWTTAPSSWKKTLFSNDSADPQGEGPDQNTNVRITFPANIRPNYFAFNWGVDQGSSATQYPIQVNLKVYSESGWATRDIIYNKNYGNSGPVSLKWHQLTPKTAEYKLNLSVATKWFEITKISGRGIWRYYHFFHE